MKQNTEKILGVPTNIVTGFLGAGKTSTILHLLKHKPKHERWAVLVNEFGEIGVDGAIIEGECAQDGKVFVREVPGGCMCCTAGLPMRVALSQLLRQAKPDRLLIEPTGLGHPKEVLDTLNEKSFQSVLTVQKIITLLDARQLSDHRYAEHDTFRQQIAIADVVVGNKQDLYSEQDKAKITDYLGEHGGGDVTLVFSEHGVIDSSLLDGPQSVRPPDSFLESLNELESAGQLEPSFPESGFIRAQNKGEGYLSVGWRFAPRFVFDHTKLYLFLSGINAERLKATFITDKGEFVYNYSQGALTEVALEQLGESKIEIIAHELSQDWEASLFRCANHEGLVSRVHPDESSEKTNFRDNLIDK